MFTSIGRTRREVTPAGRKVAKLGYFQSAQVNGLGQIIKWDPLTKSPVYDSIADSQRRLQMVEDALHPGPPYRSGGNFLSLKYANEYDPGGTYNSGTYLNLVSNPSINGGIPYVNRRYVGGFAPPPNSFFQTGADMSNPASLLVKTNPVIPSMANLGTRAWNATKPHLEQASGFVFAVEGDEAPRMVRGSIRTANELKQTAKGFRDVYIATGGRATGHLMTPKKVAREFLNQNFGWIPFIQDLIKFDKVIGHYQNLVRKLTKQNGRPVRRMVPLDNSSEEKVLSKATYSASGGSYPMPCHAVAWTTDFFTSPPSYQTVERKSTTAWGIGRWTYYRPEFDSSKLEYYSAWSEAMRFLTVTGFRISPSALYNAIPWTWLIDYVVDIGNFVDYFTDVYQDQVVSNYCYALQTQRVTREFTNVLPLHSGSVSLNFSRVIETKQRRQSDSPFGFDLSWDMLSLRQLAILGALGISRS